MSRRRDVVNWAMDNDTSHLPAEPVTDPAPPADDVLVACSVRLPLRTFERVKATAEQLGTSVSALVRNWVELGLAETADDRPVSLAAVRRAIAHAAEEPVRPAA
jgi:hypothetical protein